MSTGTLGTGTTTTTSTFDMSNKKKYSNEQE